MNVAVNNDKWLNVHLSLAMVILFLSLGWFVFSFYSESESVDNIGWFARSGAILVLASFWSALLTRPITEDAEVPDFLNTYEHALGRATLAKEHWTVKYGLSKKLVYVELLLGSIGTITWAYGDLVFK